MSRRQLAARASLPRIRSALISAIPDIYITSRTRKRLWNEAGKTCAFPGCETRIFEPTPDGSDATTIGIECHIVAQKDDPAVARSESLLTEEERNQFAHLITHRHSFNNLVVMCGVHSEIVDDPKQGYSVEWMVKVKADHEAAVDEAKSPDERQHDADILKYLGIVDEWAERVRLDDWDHWVGHLVMDGHPWMEQEDFDALTETRQWLFSRHWPGTIPGVDDAFENFRRVAQDLQNVLAQHPHKHLREEGRVAIARFYNDPEYWPRGDEEPDFGKLDDLYDFYSELVEDLAYELTRAANLIIEVVRRKLLVSYRSAEGVLTLTAGPFMDDLSIRTSRPHYAADAGLLPYEGLDGFLAARASRDIVFGEGGRPPGVRLPGDPIRGR